MLYYEYDADGWLLGWHHVDGRANSTETPYEPIPPARARWVQGSWIEDGSREVATAAAAAQAAVVAAVQARLDAHAQAWGYDDIFTACTYAEENEDPQFMAEGRSLRKWRSQTWRACYANAGASSLEALIALLPAPPVRPS